MKRRKVAKLMAVVALVGAVGVGGSLALLSAQSNNVTNTFAAGKGIDASKDLTLFEDDNVYNLNEDGVTEQYRDTTNAGKKIDINGIAYTNLEPNSTLPKNPAVQISQGTANCYLFAKVTNGLADINGVSIDGIYSEDGNANWKLLDGTSDIYYYVKTGAGDQEKGSVIDTTQDAYVTEPLFNTITLAEDADIYNDDGQNKLTEANNIDVKALVVQATSSDNWEQAESTAKSFNWQ